MFIKNILRAFDRETPIEVYNKDRLGLWTLIDNYKTVGQFMDSGLMTYTEVDEEELFYVRDNKLIIWIKNVN